MEATQAIDFTLDSTQDVTVEGGSSGNGSKKLIASINFDKEHREYNVFQGDTISIGRDPEACQIVFQNKVGSSVGC